jgi:hypothetical protein
MDLRAGMMEARGERREAKGTRKEEVSRRGEDGIRGATSQEARHAIGINRSVEYRKSPAESV